MSTYTWYVVTRNAGHHYAVLMANNGKPILNEPCGRAHKLERTILRLLHSVLHDDVRVVRISEKEFRAKHPHYPRNAGGRKRSTTKTKP